LPVDLYGHRRLELCGLFLELLDMLLGLFLCFSIFFCSLRANK
jgi:hypothetical protein